VACVALAVLMGRSVESTAESIHEEAVQGSGEWKIAIIPVTGTIQESAGGFTTSAATPESLKAMLDQAENDSKVKAIILEVGSPGGEVVASDEMYREILDFKQRTHKPVVVRMVSTAASGAYYISMAADKIVANPMTLTGSLGVIMEYMNFSKAADKVGISQVVIRSGEFKDIGNPFRDPTKEERQILQQLVDEAYNQFVNVIAQGRKMPTSRVRQLADGRVYSGQQAKQLGLVDELGNLDKAVQVAEQLAGIKNAQVVRYRHSVSLLSLLSSRLQMSTEPDAMKILRSAGYDITPRLMYIYRP